MNLHYPVRNCHFCNQIMIYTRYANGSSYAYCNDSCMGFTYFIEEGKVHSKEFIISDADILSFRLLPHLSTDGSMTYKNRLIIKRANNTNTAQIMDNLFTTDPSIILDKISSFKLLEKIKKTILLMD